MNWISRVVSANSKDVVEMLCDQGPGERSFSQHQNQENVRHQIVNPRARFSPEDQFQLYKISPRVLDKLESDIFLADVNVLVSILSPVLEIKLRGCNGGTNDNWKNQRGRDQQKEKGSLRLKFT